MNETSKPSPASWPALFFVGVGDVWRGLGWLLSTPSLWLWALIPFVINTVLFGLLGWGVWHLLASRWLEPIFLSNEHWYLVVLGWVLGVIAFLLLGLIVVFCFVPLATVVAAPFNDLLSEKVERRYSGSGVDEPFSLKSLMRSVKVSLVVSLNLMLRTVVMLICTTPLYLIPVAGAVAATIFQACITIRYLSLEYTSYSMDRRYWGYDRRRAFQRANRARTLGLGTMAFCVMLIPVLNALFIPVSAVAGTLLFCDAELKK